MKDGQGRNIDYLRVSVTERCNLRCIYCMPQQRIQEKECEDILMHEDIIKVVRAAAALGIKKVRYTGGEPLLLRDIDKLIYETSRIESIDDIALTTNGLLLERMAEDLKNAGLKRVNISLDTLNRDKFSQITRLGELDKVLQGIEKCLSLDLKPVKINTVLMRGINDDEIDDFICFAKDNPVEVRFIELMPIGEGAKLFDENSVSLKDVMQQHPKLIPLTSKKGSTAELYTLEGAKGNIGFINPISCKFCSSCNRIRLTSSGTIKPCLHSEQETSIMKYLQDENALKDALKTAIFTKPSEHHLEEEKSSRSRKMMYQVGG